MCGGVASDVHHIVYRSQGGTDDVSNLIALCRTHHEKAHSKELTDDFLVDCLISKAQGKSNNV